MVTFSGSWLPVESGSVLGPCPLVKRKNVSPSGFFMTASCLSPLARASSFTMSPDTTKPHKSGAPRIGRAPNVGVASFLPIMTEATQQTVRCCGDEQPIAHFNQHSRADRVATCLVVQHNGNSIGKDGREQQLKLFVFRHSAPPMPTPRETLSQVYPYHYSLIRRLRERYRGPSGEDRRRAGRICLPCW
jgi:hypothetical protein